MRGAWIAAASLAPCLACDSSDPVSDCAMDANSVFALDGAEGGGAPADASEAAMPSDAADGLAPSDGGGAEAATFSLAYVRLANWSPDAPAVDFCIAPPGSTSFRGPLVSGLAAALGASTIPLTAPNPSDAGKNSSVSAYVSVPPGPYIIRVVAWGSRDCSVGIPPDSTTPTSLAAGTFTTVALLGEELPANGDAPLQLASFTDTTVPGSGVLLRFINAAPAFPFLDLGTGTGVGFTASFSDVAFGKSGAKLASASPPSDGGGAGDGGKGPDAGSSIDSNGYWSVPPSTLKQPLSARDPTSAQDAVTATLTVANGSVITIAIVGGTSSASPPKAPKMLRCVDNAGNSGEMSDCSLL